MKRFLAVSLFLLAARANANVPSDSSTAELISTTQTLSAAPTLTILVAPTATLTIDGGSTSSFTSLARTGTGSIVGTIPAVKRAFSRVTARVSLMQLTPAPGELPVAMVGVTQPVDGGTIVRAFPVRHGLCDPGSLAESLTALKAQKAAIESELLALDSSIESAELTNAAVCSAAFDQAVSVLTLEIPAAGLLGDLGLAAGLTAQLDALKQSPPICDLAGVATLDSVSQATLSELAMLDLAIQGVLDVYRYCVALG